MYTRDKSRINTNKYTKTCTQQEKENTNKSILIVTHNNHFHMDDVIACYMLKRIHPDAKIVRTREKEEIAKGDYVVDVGGVYNASTHRYDHHQRGFEETYSSKHDIKLSSAGLVYKHHAEEFLQAIGIQLNEHKEAILSQIYDEYFVSVDANDNGIEIADAPRYRERCLDDVVRALNPLDMQGMRYEEQERVRLEHFHTAMLIMGSDLVRFCIKTSTDTVRSAKILDDAFKHAENNEYIVLDTSCMFEQAISAYYNKKYNKNILIVIYPRGSETGNVYAIRCLNAKNMKYKPEAPLCERWRGLREDNLHKQEAQMQDALFVHATGFCGAAKTLETAKYMVEQSLAEYHTNKQDK